MSGLMTHLKMHIQLLLAFSAMALFGSATIGWGMYTIIQLDQEIKQITNEAFELAEIEEVQVFLQEGHIAVSNFQRTGETRYLSEYEQAEELSNYYLNRALVNAASEEQRNAINHIQVEKEEYNQEIEDVIKTREEEGTTAAQALAERTLEAEGVKLEEIQDQVERFVYLGELQLESYQAETETLTRYAIFVSLVGLLLIAGAMILAMHVTNQVTEPIMHLSNAIAAFENDIYTPELLEHYTKRREDFGRLSRSFNNMVMSITSGAAAKDQLLYATGKFVPEAYLDFLEKTSITDIELGDHVSAEMGIMFSDIRSFTTISEGMTPKENFEFVNEYLKRVSPTIQKYEGFVVKFLGDGMMAIFPYSVEDALIAGIEKINVVTQFNADRAAQNQPPIGLGIGIHTGHMMVGMIGEEDRLQGDAFSDNVNLTSRIEGLTKFFGISLIISGESLARIEEPGKYKIRNLGKVQVKGRNTPIGLHEIYDAETQKMIQLKDRTLEDYNNGLKLFTLGKFTEAQAAFTKVIKENPEDKTAIMFLEQCSGYIESGTPEYWDGVIVVTSK